MAILFEVSGSVEVFQQIPHEIIDVPPSLDIYPPLLAEEFCMLEMDEVITIGKLKNPKGKTQF